MSCKRLVLILVAMVVACFTTAAGAFAHPLEFEEISMHLEYNASDGGLEVVTFAKGVDEGLKYLKVYDPKGKKILELNASKSHLGAREMLIESPEPSPEEILQAYAEGEYTFVGRTFSGMVLRGHIELYHPLPEGTLIAVDIANGIISWDAVPGAVMYVFDFKKEDDDRAVFKLTSELPATITSFEMPRSLLEPGDYQVGIGVVAENGNVTVVEEEFSIPE